MPFQNNHEYRWKPINDRSLDQQPICFKGRKGQKEQIKIVPDWQERLREFIDQLISDLPKNE